MKKKRNPKDKKDKKEAMKLLRSAGISQKKVRKMGNHDDWDK